MKLILLALCLIAIYGILLIGKADCKSKSTGVTLAQYKSNCTSYKLDLTESISEVNQIKSSGDCTTAQKNACVALVAALKKGQAAANKCDPKCTCKGKTPAAGMTCLKNSAKPVNAAITKWQSAFSG